jgi:hypothetical protein
MATNTMINPLMLAGLKLMKEVGPVDEYCGICHNLSTMTDGIKEKSYVYDEWYYSEELLHELFETWPKFSGDIEYPIPYLDGEMTPRQAYKNIENLWKGPYGDLRKELLDHCINELEGELS